MSSEFARVWEGVHHDCEFVYPDHPPPWLDLQLYERGIKFYHSNLTGILMSNGESLVSGLCIPSFYKALTFSGDTNRKRDALVRYRDTALHVFCKWYTSNPWIDQSDAASSLKIVNSMHRKVSMNIRNAGEDFERIVKEKSEAIEPQEQASQLFKELEIMRETQEPSAEYRVFVENPRKFTEFDMFLVQCAFFGGPFLYPDWYGCSSASEEDLLGFLHVWRVMGYYLGIQDKHNGAQFDVATTRRLGYEVLERIIKPCCLHIDQQTIHLGQQIFSEPSNYYVWIYRNYYMIGLELRELWSSFSWRQVYWYYARFMFTYYLYPLPGLKQLINMTASRFLDKINQRMKQRKANKQD